MCRSMADIRSTAAEIRRGKKEEGKRETTGQKYNGPLLHRAAINTRSQYHKRHIQYSEEEKAFYNFDFTSNVDNTEVIGQICSI